MKFKHFSEEFSVRLLEYKDNRAELIRKLVRVVENSNSYFYRIPKDISLFDALKDADGSAFSGELKKEFDLELTYIKREGFRMLIPEFKTQDDIQLTWDLFEVAIKYAQEPTVESKKSLIKLYDKCLNLNDPQKYKWYLMYFLNLISPDVYVNVYPADYIIKQLPDLCKKYNNFEKPLFGEEYFSLIDDLHEEINQGNTTFKTFSELKFLGIDYLVPYSPERDKKIAEFAQRQFEIIENSIGIITRALDETTKECTDELSKFIDNYYEK